MFFIYIIFRGFYIKFIDSHYEYNVCKKLNINGEEV